MQEHVKHWDSEAIIRFVDVCKTFKYHGGARRLGDEADEDGIGDVDAEAEEQAPKICEARTALRNINISILPGERVGIVGVNGSGKTTLLSLLSGISLPSSGYIIGRGTLIPLNHVTRPLDARWDGRRNLRVLARLLGFSAELIDERLGQIASFADMKEALSQPVRTYSRNMYARLAFAAALELDGDIYVSDDALGAGDPAYRAKCFNRLVDLCQSGKTLIFATHKLKLVQQLCTRAIWLDRGEVRGDGDPSAIAAQYMAVLEEPATSLGGDEDGTPGDALDSDSEDSFETWFKDKYGIVYPLASARTNQFRRIENEDISGQTLAGGVIGIECLSTSNINNLVADNEVFRLRVELQIPLPNVDVDLMLEVIRVRGKMLLYQSLPSAPIKVTVPQTLTAEIPIEGRLLPDNVYLIRAKAVLHESGGSALVSMGEIYLATNNCGPGMPSRAAAFVPPDSQQAVPISFIELDWHVSARSTRESEDSSLAILGST